MVSAAAPGGALAAAARPAVPSPVLPSPVLGIIGGMSWHASAEYYRIANELAAETRGGQHSARILLESLDFGELLALVGAERIDDAIEMLRSAAKHLEAAGADAVLLAASTAHQWYAEVAASIGVPLVHVAEPVHRAAEAAGYRRLGILGTAQTRRAGVFDFARRGETELVFPDDGDQAALDRLIIELTQRPGQRDDTERLGELAAGLEHVGVDAIVLACTDLTPIAESLSVATPVLDSTRLHVARVLCEPGAAPRGGAGSD